MSENFRKCFWSILDRRRRNFLDISPLILGWCESQIAIFAKFSERMGTRGCRNLDLRNLDSRNERIRIIAFQKFWNFWNRFRKNIFPARLKLVRNRKIKKCQLPARLSCGIWPSGRESCEILWSLVGKIGKWLFWKNRKACWELDVFIEHTASLLYFQRAKKKIFSDRDEKYFFASLFYGHPLIFPTHFSVVAELTLKWAGNMRRCP